MEAAVATPGIGHNQPPPDPFEASRSRVDALIATANRWLLERPEITDEEMAAKADDFMNQLTAEAKAVDEARKAQHKPHDDAKKAIQLKWCPLIDMLGTAKELFRPRITAWLRAKQARAEEERKRQEAEALAKLQAAEDAKRAAQEQGTVEATIQARQAAEAAEVAVAETARPVRAQVKGNYATKARSLRKVWKYRVTDAALVPREWLCIDETKISQAIRRADAPVREIAGIEIYCEEIAV